MKVNEKSQMYSSKEIPKKKSCLKFFEMFDGFGQQIQFQVNKQEKFTSIFGGLCFTIFYIISLAYVGYNFYLFITRQIFTLTSATKTNQGYSLQVSKFKYLFSLGIYITPYNEATEFVDEYLDIYFSLVEKDQITGETKVKNYPFKYCTYEDVSQSMTREYFDKFYLQYTFCPSVDLSILDFAISGDLSTEIFNYIDITIGIKKEKIAEAEKIKEFLKVNPVFAELSLYNQDINYDEFSEKIQTDVFVFNQFMDLDFFKKSDIFYASLNFTSDDNILWPSPQLTSDILVSQIRDYSIHVVDRESTHPEARNLMRFVLRLDNEAIIYERSYMKITDFIANMSGLISQAVLFLYIVVGYVNQKASQQKIINKTMKFKGHKKINHELLVVLIHQENSSLKRNFQRNNKYSVPIEKKEESDKTVRLEDVVLQSPDQIPQNHILSNTRTPLNPLIVELPSFPEKKRASKNKSADMTPPYKKLTSCQILFSCCCKRKYKSRMEIIDKGEERINHYLDVLTYLKKMREIEVLKYILLNEDQLSFFNFISSPSVDFSAEVEDNIQGGGHILNLSTIEKIKMGYQKMNSKDVLSHQDQKLLELFSMELKKFE